MFKKYITAVSLMIALSGCNYLDFDEATGQSKDFAYGYFDELGKNVTNIYGQLQNEYGVLDGALREAATDNAVYTWQNNQVYDIYNNVWSPINTIDSNWDFYYRAIRSANVFLENYSVEKLERFQYNENYEDDLAKAKIYPYEVRFLRAFFFFELARRYGDIPILTRSYQTDEINEIQKSSFPDVVSFIVKECDEVAPFLPVSYRSFYLETGRATQGAVLALKSRVLLYAASPLHNQANDASKWDLAAKAAGDLISKADLGNWYSLVSNVNLFSNGNNVLTAKELIFERRNGNSNDFEARNLPIGFEGGNSGNTPTQNLVDAFEMKDGTPFDWNNPAHAANPYLNRDPRFYKTIAYNGSTLMGITVETFNGGKNGLPINGATLTGYYLKKYIDETVSLNPTTPVKKPHHYVLFRYAEILLNYAEALNEWKGPDYKDGTYMLSAREALNRIRVYAKMPAITGDNSREAFRDRIRNERRVELAFEDQRFWDIRRWKTGESVKTINGISIDKNGSGYQYTKQEVQNRVWDDKMYLYPIPQSEIFMNGNLKQNPGW
ncbi:MAG: RagB/SusD family nutrient uptake outer membrane protein [Prolixibacteraceae bacterium]